MQSNGGGVGGGHNGHHADPLLCLYAAFSENPAYFEVIFKLRIDRWVGKRGKKTGKRRTRTIKDRGRRRKKGNMGKEGGSGWG